MRGQRYWSRISTPPLFDCGPRPWLKFVGVRRLVGRRQVVGLDVHAAVPQQVCPVARPRAQLHDRRVLFDRRQCRPIRHPKRVPPHASHRADRTPSAPSAFLARPHSCPAQFSTVGRLPEVLHANTRCPRLRHAQPLATAPPSHSISRKEPSTRRCRVGIRSPASRAIRACAAARSAHRGGSPREGARSELASGAATGGGGPAGLPRPGQVRDTQLPLQ